MLNVLVVVHIVVAVFLIILVLLQDSKGGAMGGMMGGGGGGGSNSLFGPTGATSLAAKATRWMAVIFALTSIGLTSYTSTGQRSVVDDITAPAAAGATAVDQAPLEESVDAEAPVLEEGETAPTNESDPVPATNQEPAVEETVEEPVEE